MAASSAITFARPTFTRSSDRNEGRRLYWTVTTAQSPRVRYSTASAIT